MQNEKILEKLRTSHIAVLGFGVSNIPLVRFLLDIGATNITVHDKKEWEALGEAAQEYREAGVRFMTGSDYLEEIEGDIIFRSPGIRPDHDGIRRALMRGAELTSEMELFFELTPATVIGVTGSDGKTTTTTLTYKILEEELSKKGGGRVYVGGNIGEPLLPKVLEMTKADYAVVELSSFQLSTMKRSPVRAAVTNVTPNHLDWHYNMTEYIDAKFNICRGSDLQRAVLNAENETTRAFSERVEAGVTLFSGVKDSWESITNGEGGARAVFAHDGEIVISDGTVERIMMKTSDIKLVGRHNVENYMTAIALLDGLVSAGSIEKVAKTFGGVEHRLEFVRELDGVQYYNSSIDSSPTRTAAALSAFTDKPIVICGGYDKHIPYDALGDVLCEQAKAVILMGDTAPAIRAAVEASSLYAARKLPMVDVSSLEEAVQAAKRLATKGDRVLLSPASASFDMFENFAVRGNRFKTIVNSME